MSKEFYAHSSKPEKNISGHLYRDHISEVVRLSAEKWKRLSPYKNDSISAELVQATACYHDLGKLDVANQDILSGKLKSNHLPVNHVDAGVLTLLNKNRIWEAFMVLGHHIGIPSVTSEEVREYPLRDSSIIDHTNKHIKDYLEYHSVACNIDFPESNGFELPSAVFLRFAFSCLVDADHFDTARHYEKEYEVEQSETRWSERMQALDKYVEQKYEDSLKDQNSNFERNKLRNEIYNACKNADINPSIRSCESPVGSGKTTAIMAHLLKVAEEKKLRHIFIVLPYTNIIKQSVDVYRKALVLLGENPEHIVAEHHHQVEFSHYKSRHLTTLWQAPIIVTTAVQFFETMAHNKPANLRKFHELPGSAVFIDEAHAAIPSWLWPQSWKWMKELSDNWNCHFILGSGSLAKFWTLPEFVEPPETVPDLIPQELVKRSESFESKRIIPQTTETFQGIDTFLDFALSKNSPRLIILNTVQSAAVIADRLKSRNEKVIHLSTALAPIDRDKIVDKIKSKLKTAEQNWTLVATSCVEAGMDFSFQTAFRESCTTASLIQVGGRVNRNGEKENAELYDFKIKDAYINQHPAFRVTRNVLDKLFKKELMHKESPSELVTKAMKWELMSDDKEFLEKVKAIQIAENSMDYPKVAELCKVINQDTRLIIVYKEIVDRIKNGERLKSNEIMKHSVQIWADKLKEMPVEEIQGQKEIYFWKGEYGSDFLGYMKGNLEKLYGVL
jgi:CRISPR-associated endonuclease/helicase Cas3